MPVLTQLNLNVGTEQNPNMVLHDLHDIRISSTDVTTVTRLLGCDAGVNSIAPLTLASAASLLGVTTAMFGNGAEKITENSNLNNYTIPGAYRAPNAATAQSLSNRPDDYAFQLWYISPFNTAADRSKYGVQIAIGAGFGIKYRIHESENSWGAWVSL